MWLAESYQYSPDYKQLTIKTRPEAMWSDGVPFTADDVAYTYNALNALGSKVKWGADVAPGAGPAPRSSTRTPSSSTSSPRAALLRIQRLQVRHRHLHDAEAHLREAARTSRRSPTSTCPRIGRSRPAPGRSSTPRPTRRCSTCAPTGGAPGIVARHAEAAAPRATCPIRASRTWPRA